MNAAVRRLMLILPVCAVLGGCTFATPYRILAPNGADMTTPGATRVVAITHAVLDPAARRIFDTQIGVISEALKDQPGIIGYRLRRELLGNEAWTMTVWQDEASRARFVASPLHRNAIALSSKAVRQSRSLHVEVPAQEAPLAWDKALALLETATFY